MAVVSIALLQACILQLLLTYLLIRSAAAAHPQQQQQQKQQNMSSCLPSDLQALRSFAGGFYGVLVDADLRPISAINESWSSEQDCCSWMGITCTSTATPDAPNDTIAGDTNVNGAGHVTELSLSVLANFSVSSATILETLCRLPLLSTLQLVVDPQGLMIRPTSILLQIPDCLGSQLSLLQALALLNLNLKGPIPSSFSGLLHLQHLDLSSNAALSGPLLPLLRLPTLTSLSLSGCAFSGSIPTFHTPLLQMLSLSDNAFSGPLPPFYNPLLQFLSLSTNYLNSTMDRFTLLSNLTGLTYLGLSENNIYGPIPSSISRLLNLQSLYLQQNSLSGALPSSLCELSQLQTLDLSRNSLSIAELLHPEYCTELINLTYLDLSSNQLTGRFPPWIGHLSSLYTLDLSSNQFASPLPDEWKNLRNVSTFNIGSGNSLNATKLPSWLFRFPRLSYLQLSSLGLQSEDVLCNTRVSMLNSTLQLLDLSGNNITGRDLLECFALHDFTQVDVSLNENPLSISLSNIQLAPTVASLSLSGCNLTGFLNDKVFEGRYLLNLSHNHLVGKIPTKYGTNLTEAMSVLDLSNNYLSGFDSYGVNSSFHSLSDIQLSNNLIAGDVSTVLQALGLLFDNCTNPSYSWSYLGLSNNKLSGHIPTSLAECQKYLASIYLDNNNLTGQIPENFGKFSEMYSIRLTNNHLKGTIPASIITKSSQLLEVSYNELEGDLKTLFSFSSPSNLLVLGLAHNHISGSIPPFLGNLTPILIVMDISYNNLTGNIPQDLYLPSFRNVGISDIDGDIKALYEGIQLVIKGVEMTIEYVLRNFRFLDLSKNHLEGVIPSHLGDLSALLQLNLSHNNLSGPIPPAFGKLLMLETLDLSFNNLEGSIPPSLSSLTKLAVFNVSYNEALVGPVPQGSQLENNESYRGDPMLCGYPFLQRACRVLDVTNGSNNKTIKDKAATWMDKWVSIPGLCVGIVVGFSGTLWVRYGIGIACSSIIH